MALKSFTAKDILRNHIDTQSATAPHHQHEALRKLITQAVACTLRQAAHARTWPDLDSMAVGARFPVKWIVNPATNSPLHAVNYVPLTASTNLSHEKAACRIKAHPAKNSVNF